MPNAGTTAYPGAIDTFNNPTGGTTYEDDPNYGHENLHAQVHEAIEAIETWLGTHSGTLSVATQEGIERLTNKTLTTPQIDDLSQDHQYQINGSELTADRVLWLPVMAGTGTAVINNVEQTLTNKTISGGTVTGALLGTNQITGGTVNNAIFGSPTITGGTINNAVLGTPTIQGPYFKVGSFTRDISAATAAIEYTGVGFQPKAVSFIAGVGATFAYSMGFDDGTTHGVIGHDSATTVNPDNYSIFLQSATGSYTRALVSAFGTDGFTLTWSKTGAPSGNAVIFYMAYR